MRRSDGSRMFIWVFAVLTAGLLTTALFAMNRSLQNAISPLFEAGRVQQTVAPASPTPAPSPTPIVLASPTIVPAADPLVGVAFAAPLDGTAGVTQAPATRPAPMAPAHKAPPKVLAAAKPLMHAAVTAAPAVPAVPAVAVPLTPPAKAVRAAVELAAALHSPIQGESLDMATLTPLTAPAEAAIVLPIPRVTSVTVTPAPPATRHHHHGDSEDSAGTNAGGRNGRLA